jgi:MYXO-CTERM domain-containing protein
VSFTYADDLCVYVDVAPLSTAGFLQVGGFSNLSAAQRYSWPNGGSSAPGTTVIGTVNLTTALAFTGNAAVDGTIWLGNGYGASGTSGTWTGSITLIGVDAVPAPGAIALLGLAGLAGRRRR